MKFIKFIVLAFLLINFSCEKDEGEDDPPIQTVFPHTDPDNAGDWTLKETVSDEFEDDVLDETKWMIQGTDGEYKSNFIGRAPSQFSTDNVRVEDGKLKIDTRWDPDFPFDPGYDEYPNGDKHYYENMTTAAVISKKYFRYGYMEIKCKAADASVTSSFWMTGQNSELDVFEFLGKPKQEHKKHLEKEFWCSVHDWSSGMGGKSVWTDKNELDWRVADDFHIYACEWNKDYLKFYADGNLITEVTREEMGDGWVLTSPLFIWVDSETFPWHGVPEEGDLPVDYEVEYIRVWQ